MSHNLLDIENISIAYDKKNVVHDFSMQLRNSEFVAIAGASGCGKSSLLKAILGFIPLEKGKIFCHNIELQPHSIMQIRRKIAYLPQDIAFPCEWVREIVELPFRLKINKGKELQTKLFEYFERLGLNKDIHDRRLSEISGGQRQRVMLAVIALFERDIILLDEPTSALDKESSTLVYHFLKNIENKPAILSVTHDTSFAELCDRTINL